MGARSLRGRTSTSTSTEGATPAAGRERQGQAGCAPAPRQATRGRAEAGAPTSAARLRHEPQRAQRLGQQPQQHANAEPGGQSGGRAIGEEERNGEEGGRR